MGGRQNAKSPRGAIGEQIFAEVDRLTADGAMKRLAAFEAVAKRSGRKVGTVAANYYRIARRRGVVRDNGGTRQPGSRAGRGKITAALRLLETALRQQEQEIARLRNENRRFQKLRQLLGS